jgi:hypothetical protein
MATDLRQHIRDLIETGARPISPDEVASRCAAREETLRSGTAWYRLSSRYRLSARAAAIVAGVVATGCAGAVVAAQLGGGPGQPAGNTNPASGTVLTVASVRRVLAVSSAALSRSGQAQIRFRDVLQGSTMDYGVTDVIYSGQNISVARHDGSPGSTTTTYVQLLVDGQYYYDAEWPPNLGWEHVTGAHPTWRQLSAADPRTLLRDLTPAARFVTAGYKVADGVRLRQLVATRPRRVPGIHMSGQLIPGERVTSLSLWVDGHGVVQHIDATLAAPSGGPRTTVSVAFTDIGRPQTVLAPAHARAVRG